MKHCEMKMHTFDLFIYNLTMVPIYDSKYKEK